MTWIDSRHRKISTGLHFQNGHHNTAKIQHCSISKVAFDLFFKPVISGQFGRLHNRWIIIISCLNLWMYNFRLRYITKALTTIIVFVNQLHDEGYSRNVSCALILISTFLLQGFIANYSNSVMYIFRLQDRRLVTH